MKYTNIKKLLIKFMGGGLINFPTRFLRWIKIDGDADGDDGGSGGGGDSGESEQIDIPFFPYPSKLVGFLDNTNDRLGNLYDVINENELIKPKDLRDYIKNKTITENLGNDYFFTIIPIYEYNENLIEHFDGGQQHHGPYSTVPRANYKIQYLAESQWDAENWYILPSIDNWPSVSPAVVTIGNTNYLFYFEQSD